MSTQAMPNVTAAAAQLAGVYTALVTPFLRGEVDYASLQKLIRFQLDNKIQGFVVNGTTAESPCLSTDEKSKIFKYVQAEVAGQVPLVMGTGSNSTAETVYATQTAEKLGAAAALVVVPYYNKPPQRGLVAHFKAAAQATRLPILLYNVPSRTITKLEVDSVAELSRVENIVGIKEASGDLSFGEQIIKKCKEGFLLTSGDDASCFELMLRGGRGVISVASHVLPKEFFDFTQRSCRADKTVAQDYAKFLPLVNELFVEANPIAVKMALHKMGILASPELRLPLMSLSEGLTQELEKKMKAVGLV